jgi:hypothetical protein
MRGTKLGWHSLEREQGVEFAGRRSVKFLCHRGHRSSVTFALGAEIPAAWDCRFCHSPAARLVDGQDAPLLTEEAAPRTHLDMVLERRSRDELEALLAEVLAALRSKRTRARLTA